MYSTIHFARIYTALFAGDDTSRDLFHRDVETTDILSDFGHASKKILSLRWNLRVALVCSPVNTERVKVAVALHTHSNFILKESWSAAKIWSPSSLVFALFYFFFLHSTPHRWYKYDLLPRGTLHCLATCRCLSFALRQTSFQPETFSFAVLFFSLPFSFTPLLPFLLCSSMCGTSRLIILILRFCLVSRGTFRAS